MNEEHGSAIRRECGGIDYYLNAIETDAVEWIESEEE